MSIDNEVMQSYVIQLTVGSQQSAVNTLQSSIIDNYCQLKSVVDGLRTANCELKTGPKYLFCNAKQTHSWSIFFL